MSFEKWIPVIRDISGTVFYITASTVSVLTFIQAKKTVFQPLKAEVFKEQIKVLSLVLSFFSGKSELELRADFAFDNLLHANIIRMYDDYAKLFFEVDIDMDQRPYSRKLCPLSVMSIEYAEKNLKVLDTYKKNDKNESKQTVDPRTKAAIWSNYVFGEIHLPSGYVERLKELESIMDSPLLPEKIAGLIKIYLNTVEENALEIMPILTKASQQMPEKYPSVTDFENRTYGWIETIYNNEFKDLETPSRKITDFVRAYFDSDGFFR